MYVLVFVTLMIALIGTYAQVYTKQVAKTFEIQTGIDDTMVSWHATATGLASYFTKTSSFSLTGCSLTSFTGLTGAPTTLLPCMGPGLIQSVVSTTRPGGTTACDGTINPSITTNPPCFTVLPAGYESNYKYYSIAFSIAGPRYFVLTFVPPPPAGSDNFNIKLLTLPGCVTNTTAACYLTQRQFPISFDKFAGQISQDPRVVRFSYGTAAVDVATGINYLSTRPVPFASGLQVIPYPIPAATVVPANSIGIISEVKTCSLC